MALVAKLYTNQKLQIRGLFYTVVPMYSFKI
jgi:hypothetical protein